MSAHASGAIRRSPDAGSGLVLMFAGVYHFRMARIALAACFVVLAYLAGTATAARPLQTAIHEPHLTRFWAQNALMFSRIQGTGSTAIRVWLYWDGVAPDIRPLLFDPANPADPNYQWFNVDVQVKEARARGLRVILTVLQAPLWAQRSVGAPRGVANAPDPGEFAAFLQAAAKRYDGDFTPVGAAGPLPEVIDWEIWNEPNLSYFFFPQHDPLGNSVAPAAYRDLVNAAAAALHAVDPRNNVVAGVLAPFGAPDGHMPLDFMRKLLCMSAGRTPQPTCGTRVEFDVWSHHPYTQGGPNHHARWPDDVSIGDLPEMRRLLQAAVRAGHVASSRPIAFWVTEFSWETNGPDPQGVQHRRHARWTAEALYRMWQSGVSLVTWWLLRDRPFPARVEQSGFFYCGRVTLQDEGSCDSESVSDDVRKRSARAFRFPFVAFPRNGRVFTWGRTPTSRAARVVVERQVGGSWRRVGTLRANRFGIFFATWRIFPQRAPWRARIARPGGETSLAFTLQRTRDIPLVHPFGCGGSLPC